MRANHRRSSKHRQLISGGIYEHRINQEAFHRLVEMMNRASSKQRGTLLFSLLTTKELADVTRRIRIAELLLNGKSYDEIGEQTGSSRNTIALVARGLDRYERIIPQLLNPDSTVGTAGEYFTNRLKRGK